MAATVILSTYNRPDALELSLWGYSRQTEPSFELIVADDGSTEETGERIEGLRAATGLDIVHLWHEDDGFRKCLILNEALVAAKADYVIFSDADCIPRADFVETHRQLARPGHFLSGGRVCLTPTASDVITRDDVLAGSIFRKDWLRAHSAVLRRRDLNKLAGSEESGGLRDRLTTTRATWNGHNASAWRSDLFAVNGFDERMSYPVEDRELGERLRSHGIRPVQVRHRAICAHLHHEIREMPDATYARNERIRRVSRGVPTSLSRLEGWVPGSDWTEHGIVKGPRAS